MKKFFTIFAFIFTIACFSAVSFADDGVWISPESGSWDDENNWLDKIIADGAGSVADFSQVDATTTIAISINTPFRTVGVLRMGDTNNTNAMQINNAGGGSLIFDNNGLGALFENVETSSNTAIVAPILLNDSLEILNNKLASNRFLEIRNTVSAGTAGLKTITLSGNSPGVTTFTSDSSIQDGAGIVRIVQNSPTSVLSLLGNNTYSGGTVIQNGGILAIETNDNLGDASGDLIFNNGTLRLILSGNSNVIDRHATLEAGGGIFRVHTSGAVYEWKGVIEGEGALTVSGSSLSSALWLTGENTYTGGTIISSGTLRINSDENLGDVSGAVTIIGNGARLDTRQSATINRDLILEANGILATSTNGNTTVWNGQISGEGSLTKQFSGTLHLTGENTYTGGTIIQAGTLRIESDANLGASGGTLTFNNGADLGRLEVRESTTSSRDIIINGNIATIGIAGTDNHTVWNGQISGIGALDKRFVGTLELTQANTYEGGTLISRGILLATNASGSATGTGSVTISDTELGFDAVLGGTGIIAPSAGNYISVFSGVIRPGVQGQGSLTFDLSGDSKLDFVAGSMLDISLGEDSTKIVFASLGDWLAGSGNAILNINLIEGFSFGRQYVVFENVTTPDFTFESVQGIDGYNYTFEWVDNNYVITVIPEPQTWVLLGVALAGFVICRMRARKGLLKARVLIKR